MRSGLGRVGVALAVCMLLAACTTAPTEEGDFVAMRATDFSTGEDVSVLELVSDSEGKWALVNFWASFCKPCLREMPYLQDISTSRSDVVVIGVNAVDRPELAEDFLQTSGVTYRILVDARGDLMAAAGVRALPATFVVAPDGRVVSRHLGEMSFAEINSMIDAALSGAE